VKVGREANVREISIRCTGEKGDTGHKRTCCNNGVDSSTAEKSFTWRVQKEATSKEEGEGGWGGFVGGGGGGWVDCSLHWESRS